MIDEKMGFTAFVEDDIMLERKKAKKKSKKKAKKKKGGGIADSWFSGGIPTGSGGMGGDGGDGGGGGGESFVASGNDTILSEIFAGMGAAATASTVNTAVAMGKMTNDPEAGLSTLPSIDKPVEEEPEVNLVDQARQLFQTLVHHPDSNRASILNSFIEDVGVTQSTAVSYYTRFMDEFGLTDDDVGQPHPGGGQGGGMGDMETQTETPYGEPESVPDEDDLEEPDNPNRAGFIRTVDKSHLIYKRQAENGTYEELWIYNIQTNTNDELEIRRDILAGTDIPVKKTKSPDGVQSYTATTMGNAQLLKVSGLPN